MPGPGQRWITLSSVAAAILLGAVLCVASVSSLFGAGYELRVYGSPYGLLDLQHAGTPNAARRVLQSWAEPLAGDLFSKAIAYARAEFVLLCGGALILVGVAAAFRRGLAAARATPSGGRWSDRVAGALDELSGLLAPALGLAVTLGAIVTVLQWEVLIRAMKPWERAAAAGPLTVAASQLATGKFLLVVVAILAVTVSGLYLLTRNRSEHVQEFFVIVRVCRFSLITVAAVGVGLCVPDQLLDAFRTLAESSLWQIGLTEVVLVVWALTVWYTARFLLNVNFQTDPTFVPGSPEFPGERLLPPILGTAAVVVFAIGAFRAWFATADSSEASYPWLLGLAIVNAVLGLAGWCIPPIRRRLPDVFRTLEAGRGLTFQRMPAGVRRLVWISLTLVGIVWIIVFLSLQTTAPYLGTVALLLGAAITITLAGSLLVWHGERANLPALSIVVAIALVFSLINDNHTVRSLRGPVLAPKDRIELVQHVKDWHAWIQSRYPGQEHPLFIVSAAGGGIRAAYWTATVLARLQDLNPAFSDHTLLVSGVSGGSLGALVFANLLDTLPPGPRASPLDCPTKRQYHALASSLLSRDFLAPTAASMLYGDFLARLLPVSFLSDRAEALEVAWERAWDDVGRQPPPGVPSPPWLGNPFARSFDALLTRERISPSRLPRSGHVPLMLLNGTIVESGTRILVSHLQHPAKFRGDLEHAFDHRQAPMRMSTAALMSARFTYVSPAGTYAPGTHVVDGGYFENSGVVTALQWWAEISTLVEREINRDQPNKIRAVFLYLDNNPPPTARQLAAGDRAQTPARMDSFKRLPTLFPELSPPVTALLHSREAHAVEARYRAKRIFGDDFIPFDTNRLAAGSDRLRLDSAPLGWVLSKRTRDILDKALCLNGDGFAKVMGLLAVSEGRRGP